MTAPSATTGIVTPEAVVLEFEPAGVASRMLAFTIDAIVQFALLMALFLGLSGALAAGADLGGAGAAAAYVGLFLIVFGYPAILETVWRGRTLGKAALGLRVVTVEGAPIGFRHAAIRSILAAVDVYATSALVGVVAIFLTRRSQRLGDLVAGTIVLRERTAARALTPVRFTPPPGLEGYAATLVTGSLSHEDYGTIRSFLLRAGSLPPHVRYELAWQIAQPLATRLRTAPPPAVGPEAFLQCVAAAYQRRMDGPAARAGGTAFRSVWGDAGRAVPAAPVAPAAPAAPVAPVAPVAGGPTATSASDLAPERGGEDGRGGFEAPR